MKWNLSLVLGQEHETALQSSGWTVHRVMIDSVQSIFWHMPSHMHIGRSCCLCTILPKGISLRSVAPTANTAGMCWDGHPLLPAFPSVREVVRTWLQIKVISSMMREHKSVELSMLLTLNGSSISRVPTSPFCGLDDRLVLLDEHLIQGSNGAKLHPWHFIAILIVRATSKQRITLLGADRILVWPVVC